MYGNTANAYKTYGTNVVTTATPEKLVIMLYEGAIRFCRLAEMAVESNDIARRNANLIKAQDIINEMRVTLNRDAGDIADQLETLYDYFYRELVTANIRNDREKIQGVRVMLTELKDIWKQIG